MVVWSLNSTKTRSWWKLTTNKMNNYETITISMYSTHNLSVRQL